MKVDKIEAFSLVVKAIERNDDKTAREIMRVISNAIKKERDANKFSEYIEIVEKKDEKLFRELIDEVIQ